jgi:hypothetical protein
MKKGAGDYSVDGFRAKALRAYVAGFAPSRETSSKLRLFSIYFLAAMLTLSCSAKAPEWKSPADAKELSALEAKTQEAGLSKKRRAELFFLWGQELAAQARGGQPPEGTSAAQLTEAAIGAFEKVVDLGAGPVDESRYNLEILWKEQGQAGKGGGESRDESKKQDADQAQKDQEGKQGKQGKQDQRGQQGHNGQQDQKGQKGDQGRSGQDKDPASADSPGDRAAEKDLSGLVRDKAGGEELEKALKAELERRSRQQEAQAGGIRPVEKDW